MRPYFDLASQLGGAHEAGQILHEHRLAWLDVAPRIEVDGRLARARNLVVFNSWQRHDGLLRIARLLCSGRTLARHHGLAALVVERRHVDDVSACPLRRACAGRIRGPRRDAHAARARGRKRRALPHTRQRTVARGREQLLRKVVERGGAHAVQLREADTHTLVEFDLERF